MGSARRFERRQHPLASCWRWGLKSNPSPRERCQVGARLGVACAAAQVGRDLLLYAGGHEPWQLGLSPKQGLSFSAAGQLGCPSESQRKPEFGNGSVITQPQDSPPTCLRARWFVLSGVLRVNLVPLSCGALLCYAGVVMLDPAGKARIGGRMPPRERVGHGRHRKYLRRGRLVAHMLGGERKQPETNRMNTMATTLAMLAVVLGASAFGQETAIQVPQGSGVFPTVGQVNCLEELGSGRLCAATYECSGESGRLWGDLANHDGRRAIGEDSPVA